MGWYCSCAAGKEGRSSSAPRKSSSIGRARGFKEQGPLYDGLFLLSSILLNVGQKAKALKYLQKVAAYDPSYNVYLEDFENDVEDFAVHLASGRRSFGVSE